MFLKNPHLDLSTIQCNEGHPVQLTYCTTWPWPCTVYILYNLTLTLYSLHIVQPDPNPVQFTYCTTWPWSYTVYILYNLTLTLYSLYIVQPDPDYCNFSSRIICPLDYRVDRLKEMISQQFPGNPKPQVCSIIYSFIHSFIHSFFKPFTY